MFYFKIKFPGISWDPGMRGNFVPEFQEKRKWWTTETLIFTTLPCACFKSQRVCGNTTFNGLHFSVLMEQNFKSVGIFQNDFFFSESVVLFSFRIVTVFWCFVYKQFPSLRSSYSSLVWKRIHQFFRARKVTIFLVDCISCKWQAKVKFVTNLLRLICTEKHSRWNISKSNHLEII